MINDELSNLFFILSFSVKLDVVAADADSELHVAPPELLFDVPFSMGCYKIREDVASNAEAITKEADLPNPSPASCILQCLQKGSEYRISGIIFKVV